MLKPSTTKLTLTKSLPGMERLAGKIDQLPDDLLHRRRTARRAMIDARRERNAMEHILTLPAEGESLHLIVDGRFEPCDLIPATRRLSHPAVITRLDISTLGFNLDNVATLANGMDQKKILEVNFVCSHYFAKSDAAIFAHAQQELGSRGGRVSALRTHAKLILMEMSDGQHFTIEGSGNLRSCKSIEQFCITNDRGLLLFHRTWLDDYIAARGK